MEQNGEQPSSRPAEPAAPDWPLVGSSGWLCPAALCLPGDNAMADGMGNTLVAKVVLDGTRVLPVICQRVTATMP